MTSFVGRAAEVKELAELIGSHRLVTLVGPGGIGKTRLAVETAAERRRALRRRGVVLRSGRGGDRRAGPGGGGGHDRRPPAGRAWIVADAIALHLERRRCLLILDNCEHVLDAAARPGAPPDRRRRHGRAWPPAASSWACAASRCGRSRPSTSAAWRSSCSSTALGERDPHFELDEAGEAAVAEICRRLDGMPLAIELAAGRTERALAAGDRSPASTTGSGCCAAAGGAKRHQTLRDTVQWSYELLSEAEAALFDRLWPSSPAGSRSARRRRSAPTTRSSSTTDVLDLLAALVDKSMVQRDRGSDDRFMLLETLRQFAEEQLDAESETVRWRERHAVYFAELVAENDRGSSDRPNLRCGRASTPTGTTSGRPSISSVRTATSRARRGRSPARPAYALYAMRYELGGWAGRI